MKRGMNTAHPGIRRVGTKDYLVRVSSRDPATGKQQELERRMTNVTLDEAREMQAVLRRKLKDRKGQGRARAPVNTGGDETLGAYARRWLTFVEKTNRRRPHAVDASIVKAELFLPMLGHMKLRDITPQDLAAWMMSLGELRQANGAPYAVETLKSAWAVLRTMLRDARVLAGIDHDPARDVKFVGKGVAPKAKAWLTREEMHAFLAGAEPESFDLRVLLWLGFTTGMRFGELTALRWADVDFERGEVRIARSQVGGKVYATKTSTNRSAPLHPDVAALMKQYEARQRERLVPTPEPGLVFPSTTGGYRNTGVFRRAMKRCAARARITKNVTPHTMRRTFNDLVRQAAGGIAARAIVGHATEVMTEHYSHVSLSEKRNAMELAVGEGLASGVRAAGVACWGPAAEPQRSAPNDTVQVREVATIVTTGTNQGVVGLQSSRSPN